MIILFVGLLPIVHGQTSGRKATRFSRSLLSAKQLADCKAIREGAKPRDPEALRKLMNIPFPSAAAHPTRGDTNVGDYVTYDTPDVLMTRGDVIRLLGKPDMEDHNSISYTGSKGMQTAGFSFYFKNGYVIMQICAGSRS